MDFSIFPTFRNVEDLVEAIKEKEGVSVREFDEAIDLAKPGPDYTIILLNFEQLLYNPKYSRVLLPNDAYDMEFISKYLANPKKADLRNHKITPSNYNIQEHDVNDILHQRKSWNNLVRLKKPKPRVSNKMMLKLYYSVKGHDYDSSSSSDDDDEQSERILQNGNSQNGQGRDQDGGGEQSGNLQNGEDQEQDDDGGKRKEKDLPISSPARRSSPRKKKDNDDHGQKDQPVAGHSRNLLKADTENHSKGLHSNVDMENQNSSPIRRSSPRKKNQKKAGSDVDKDDDYQKDEPVAGHSRNLLKADVEKHKGLENNVEDKNSSRIRRSSPRKKNQKKAGSDVDNDDDGQKDQPVAGHSRNLLKADTKNREVDNVEDSSHDRGPPPAKKQRGMEFYSQAFVPPLDKRNRVIRNGTNLKKRVTHPIWLGKGSLGGDDNNNEEVDDGVEVVAATPESQESPRVTAAAPAGAAELEDSDVDIETVSPPKSPPRKKKVVAASRQRAAAPDSEDDDGVEVVAATPATPDSQNVQRNSSRVVPAAAAVGRAPAPAADSDIELEDSDESHVEVQSSPERRPGSSNNSSGSGGSGSGGQVRGRRVSAGQDLGGRRPGAVLRGYSHADSQHMLNLVVRNGWGRYVKGNTLWKFVVKHKLLEHRVGLRSDQGLMGQFKKHIGPKVERMTTGGTHPFVISSQDLKKYKKARAEAAAQPHANFFPASRYRVEDVVRV